MSTTVERIRAFLKDGEAALITTPYNRRYVTGFSSSAGTVVVTPGSADFIIDFRYHEMAKAAVQGLNVVLQDKLYEQITGLLKKAGARTVYVENLVTVEEMEDWAARLPDFEIRASRGLTALLVELRSIKTEAELACMDRAQQITDYAFSQIVRFIRPGMTELEIAAEMEYIMKKQGAVEFAFETICVSGENSSKPHGVPGDRCVQPGDFITMDFGARYNGYCSDMTRTVAVGHVTDEMKRVYETVLKAQLETIAISKAGVRGCEMDARARGIINEAGYEGCFGHGLGHSVGLEIHEWPRASAACDEILKPGMLMTVEPGIYLPGKFGVRIEDMVVITETGCRDFTQSPKQLIIL